MFERGAKHLRRLFAANFIVIWHCFSQTVLSQPGEHSDWPGISQIRFRASNPSLSFAGSPCVLLNFILHLLVILVSARNAAETFEFVQP